MIANLRDFGSGAVQEIYQALLWFCRCDSAVKCYSNRHIVASLDSVVESRTTAESGLVAMRLIYPCSYLPASTVPRITQFSANEILLPCSATIPDALVPNSNSFTVFNVAIAINNDPWGRWDQALLLEENHFVRITAIYQGAHFSDRRQLPMLVLEIGEIVGQVGP